MRVDRLVMSVEGHLASLLTVCRWQVWVHECQNKKEDFLLISLPWVDIWTHLLYGYNNGLMFDFYIEYLLLALSDSGQTKMVLISGCLGIVIEILQNSYETNVN